jgi:hypothetical protein
MEIKRLRPSSLVGPSRQLHMCPKEVRLWLAASSKIFFLNAEVWFCGQHCLFVKFVHCLTPNYDFIADEALRKTKCIHFPFHLHWFLVAFDGMFQRFFDLKWKLDVGLVGCRSSTAISKLLIGDILGTWWFLSSDVLKFPLSWRVCNFVLKFPLSWIVVTFPLSWRLCSVVLEFPLSWGVCSVVLEFPLSWGVFEFHLCWGVCKN